MVIEAMVMVIMSNGMPVRPITPSTNPAANTFGVIAISDNFIERNNTTNINMMPTNTAPRVEIWLL